MARWQYAQLRITVDGRRQEKTRTVLWQGPGQGAGEDFSDSDQTVVQLLNRFGADGWELAGQEEHQDGVYGRSYWDVGWSLTIYTFKRSVPE